MRSGYQESVGHFESRLMSIENEEEHARRVAEMLQREGNRIKENVEQLASTIEIRQIKLHEAGRQVNSLQTLGSEVEHLNEIRYDKRSPEIPEQRVRL